MTFIDALKVGIDGYADFTGRSSRSEYWWFALGNLLFNLLVPLVAGGIGYAFGDFSGCLLGVDVGSFMAFIVSFLPMLAVSVRRLHDTGHSGWYYLVCLIPLAGGIWFLILMLTPSAEKNQYGLPTYS